MAGAFVSIADLAQAVRRHKAAGRRVVLCNGVFDLLHVGHVRYLRAAKALGDVLVVAINDDASAGRLKGAGRPFMPARERAEILCALDCVDYVTAFPDDAPRDVLERVRPDVHAKGTDYTAENVPEADLDRSLGIEVAIAGDPKDHSTTDLAAKIAGGSVS
jgi:rfaE bifunctional protein nucleotidyltransferase chain/domain